MLFIPSLGLDSLGLLLRWGGPVRHVCYVRGLIHCSIVYVFVCLHVTLLVVHEGF